MKIPSSTHTADTPAVFTLVSSAAAIILFKGHHRFKGQLDAVIFAVDWISGVDWLHKAKISWKSFGLELFNIDGMVRDGFSGLES